MLLISTILLSLLSGGVSYAYHINRIPTSLTNKHNIRVATTAIYQRPPSYDPPPYDNDYYYDEYDDIRRRDPFDYFDDYEDVDLPPPLGYNNEPQPQPNNNNYRPQQDDINFEFDMTPSNQNRVPNNSRSIQRGTISIKEQQTAYRSTKYNRSTSWQSKQNYRLDQTPYGTPNVYPPSNNNLSNGNSNSNRQDFQRTSGSPSTWSQQLYDTQNNFNPSTSSLPTQFNPSTSNQFNPSSTTQDRLQSSRYGTLPGQSPLLNTRSSSYERGGDLVPNGTPSSGFNRDGILSPNNLYPSNNPNNPYPNSSSRGGTISSNSLSRLGSNIGEYYTDNFRRGPGSEDFRQSTKKQRGSIGINTHGIVGGGRPSRDIGIGQGMSPRDTFDGRMGDEFDYRDDYEFDREEWDDDEFDEINDRRERWDSIADTRRQEVGGVGREGNSYYYEPQPGDYTYDGQRRRDERSRRDTEDLLGRGDIEKREEYEYNSGDFAWQRRRRRREQDDLPPPQQENNREVAFNRSRPTSIGNIANTIPRRSNPTIDVTSPFNNNQNSSRRPDSIGRKAWSDSSPSSNNKKSPTFTYQNEKNDYRRRGERQSSQYGREIAFGRNEAATQYGGNTYSQDRRRSSLETKSSTFGQMRPPPRNTERINPQQQQQQNQQQQRNRVQQPPPPPPQQQQYDRGGMNRPIEQPPNTSRWSNQPVQRPVEPQQSRPQRNTKQLKSTQKPQKYSNQGPLRNEFKKKNPNPFDFVDDIIKNGVNILDQIRDVRGDTTTSSSKKNKNSRMNKKRKSKSSSSLEEDKITKVLLADARSYIISDTSLRNILGDSISIGEVYTRSYSSTMVNGTNRSRCQISFEVNGSRDSGKGTLIANQEDIIKLDVDIGNDVIEVNIRRPESFNVRDIGR